MLIILITYLLIGLFILFLIHRFQYKHGKYRIAATIFTEAIKHAEIHAEDLELLANLYNNRGVCQYYIENYATGLKDFLKALTFKPDYTKSWRKAVECCLKLGKADDGLKILEKGLKNGLKDEWEMEKRLKIAQVSTFILYRIWWQFVINLDFYTQKQAALTKVKDRLAEKALNKEHQVLLEKIRQSQVKLLNPNFLAVENPEAVVKIGEEGNLVWPVLFYYPEHSTSDFVKEFNDQDRYVTWTC